jgi:hypothetical protein
LEGFLSSIIFKWVYIIEELRTNVFNQTRQRDHPHGHDEPDAAGADLRDDGVLQPSVVQRGAGRHRAAQRHWPHQIQQIRPVYS